MSATSLPDGWKQIGKYVHGPEPESKKHAVELEKKAQELLDKGVWVSPEWTCRLAEEEEDEKTLEDLAKLESIELKDFAPYAEGVRQLLPAEERSGASIEALYTYASFKFPDVHFVTEGDDCSD